MQGRGCGTMPATPSRLHRTVLRQAHFTPPGTDVIARHLSAGVRTNTTLCGSFTDTELPLFIFTAFRCDSTLEILAARSQTSTTE